MRGGGVYNPLRMRPSSERAVLGTVVALSLVILGLQAFVLRPHLWPAGAGLALSGETVMGTLAAPRPIAVIRPPNVRDVMGSDVSVQRIFPGGAAERAGLREGDVILTLPRNANDILRLWRDQQRIRPADPITLNAGGSSVTIERPAIWSIDNPPRRIGPGRKKGLGPGRARSCRSPTP